MAGEPSHVDLSVLWVPIMPETSKLGEQMEKAGKDATESFGKGSEKLGDKITESVQKSSKKVEDAVGDVGEKASQQFGNRIKGLGGKLADAIGPEAKKMLGDRLEDTVGGALDGVLGDKSKWGGKLARSIGDWGLDEIKGKLGGLKDSADKAGQSIGGIADGNKGKLAALVGNFGNIKDAVQATGVKIDDLPGPLQDVVNKTNEAKEAAAGFSAIFAGLPGVIGAVMAPLAALGGAVYALRDQEKAGLFDKTDAAGHEDWWKVAGGVGGSWLEKQYNKVFHPGDSSKPSKPPPTPSDLLLGPGGSSDQASSTFKPGGDPKRWAGTLGSGSDAYDFFSSGQPLGSSKASTPSAAGLNLSTIPIAAQKYANDCIDASARIILSHSGVNMTEDQMMGVIAPGGTIDSQAAGMNRLNPAGGFKAMAGSGGSPAAMFAAIKASIDSGTGSVLNVAPGSSLAGRNFSEGHFIAATGYNPDGTINLSDTAGGTKYSVSAADAFQATRGRGIVAGTGAGPAGAAGPASPLSVGDPSSVLASGGGSGGSGRGSITAPIGNQHDPIYTTSVSPDGSPTSGSGGDAAQQLGSGFLDGIMQSVGLDGSVFKTFGGASNPMDFGATKMGMGLLNWGMGLAQQKGGGKMPGMGASVPGAAGLQESPTRGSGGYTYNHYGDNNPFTVNGPTDVPSLKNMQNAAPTTPYAAQTSQPAFGN